MEGVRGSVVSPKGAIKCRETKAHGNLEPGEKKARAPERWAGEPMFKYTPWPSKSVHPPTRSL